MQKGLLKSLFQLSKQILFKRRPNVIFYYPQLFNRSKDGTNPYFDPLLKLCDDNNIKYLLLEESSGPGYNTDPRSLKADAIYWFAWLMHKIMITIMHHSLHETDKKIGRLLDFFTFHRLRAKTYITISNSMIDVLGEINPHGNVYDMQHGIIYYGHPGYFLNDNEMRPEFNISNRRVLLWGNLYKKNLSNLPGGIDSEDKFIIAGYPMHKKVDLQRYIKEKNILVSLQFTSDISTEVSAGILDMLKEFAIDAIKQDYCIILKHHPRFANEVDLNPLLNKYGVFIQITNSTIAELSGKIKLHVTWGSTTALEYAAYGIPTYFLRDSRFDWATEIFYGQYCYPLYDGLTTKDVLKRIEDDTQYHNDCRVIKNWYESAYSPMNEELLIRVLKGEKHEK